MKAIIEIPAGSRYKYEVNKHTGALKLDRILEWSCPANYGFIPNTSCPDGDELDVFALRGEAIPPLTEVTLRVVGVFKCLDQGVSDDKILAVVRGFEDPYPNEIEEVKTYLERYKAGFKVLAYEGVTEANLIIDEALKKGQY